MRSYPNVPIWLRPTDWENPYGPAAYDESEIKELVTMRKEGKSLKEIGKRFGISIGGASRIVFKYVRGK